MFLCNISVPLSVYEKFGKTVRVCLPDVLGPFVNARVKRKVKLYLLFGEKKIVVPIGQQSHNGLLIQKRGELAAPRALGHDIGYA